MRLRIAGPISSSALRAPVVSTPDPIFVFGLHRSGSTLVEQILASHPQIEGTAELTVMNTIAARLRRTTGRSIGAAIEALEPSEIKAIGEEYIERTRPFRHSDKPLFRRQDAGQLDERDADQAGLAERQDHRRPAPSDGVRLFELQTELRERRDFSYSLRDIGAFYRDYWRFMRHFDVVQPGAVHRVLNERLIEDPEARVAAPARFRRPAVRSRPASNPTPTSAPSARPARSRCASRSTATASITGAITSRGSAS